MKRITIKTGKWKKGKNNTLRVCMCFYFSYNID